MVVRPQPIAVKPAPVQTPSRVSTNAINEPNVIAYTDYEDYTN